MVVRQYPKIRNTDIVNIEANIFGDATILESIFAEKPFLYSVNLGSESTDV